jgi:predicted RND superfamily exporter protein
VDRVAKLIVERSKVFLGLTALFTILSVISLFFISFNADVSAFLTEGHEVGEEFAALQERYGSTDTINVLVVLEDGTFEDRDALADLTLIGSKLRALSGVQNVSSVVPQEIPETGRTLTSAMISSAPDEIVDQLISGNPAADLLLSEDKTAAMIIVTPEEGADIDLAREIGELSWPDSVEVAPTGQPMIYATILDRLTWFLLVMPPVIVALLLGTFYANIGDVKLSVLSIVPAALGSLWTFGTISTLGIDVDIITIIVPIFVIVMGSADGLHFVTHYQEECDRTDDVVERVTTTLRQIGTPMILTTLSTMAGFLSLLVTDVSPIRQLGVLTAIGIAYAGIISFFTLPAILSRQKIEPRHHKVILGGRLTAGIKALAMRRWFAAGLAVGIIIFGAVFIPQIEVDSDQLFFFKQTDEIRMNFETMAEEFGAATPLTGEFAYDPDDPGDVERLLEVERELEELPGVVRVVSAADIASQLPAEQSEALLAGEIDSPLGPMVVDEGMRFVLFPGDFETEDLREWLAFAEETDEITALTGMPVLWDEIARLVLRAQMASLVAAFVLVFLLLLVTYRNLWHTIVSLIPIALTVTMLLAFISASGINLNLITAIASSIVIGVGIDYAIHLVAAIDYQKADGRSGYVLRAIDKAGRPIVTNALGIAVGLTGLWLSPFLMHQHISMIMWVSMTTAALTTLTVIPALMPAAGMRDESSEASRASAARE